LPPLQYLPPSQAVQSTMLRKPVWPLYVPDGHAAGTSPSMQKKPAGHSPLTVPFTHLLPAGHGEHTAIPSACVYTAATPLPHCRGVLVPSGQCDPVGQMPPTRESLPGVAVGDASVQKYPALHLPVGAVRPSDAQYQPPVHAVQLSLDTCPSAPEKVPAGHANGLFVPTGQ